MANAGKIDLNTLKRYTSAQAIKDFDELLDRLPINVGYNALLAAAFVWGLAGTAVFFTSAEVEKASKLHASLVQIQALQPPVPVLNYVPVVSAALKPVTTKITAIFKGVTIAVEKDGSVTISTKDEDYLPQFLAAISYLQRGARNWKVRINTLCAGRDCPKAKLSANLKVETTAFGSPGDKKEENKKDDKKTTKKDTKKLELGTEKKE